MCSLRVVHVLIILTFLPQCFQIYPLPYLTLCVSFEILFLKPTKINLCCRNILGQFLGIVLEYGWLTYQGAILRENCLFFSQKLTVTHSSIAWVGFMPNFHRHTGLWFVKTAVSSFVQLPVPLCPEDTVQSATVPGSEILSVPSSAVILEKRRVRYLCSVQAEHFCHLLSSVPWSGVGFYANNHMQQVEASQMRLRKCTDVWKQQ